MIAAAALYLCAHALRVARLVLLIGDAGPSVRSVGLAQAGTAAAGLLPFKVGEILRVLAIGRAIGGLAAGVRAVWIERTFDAAAIAAASMIVLRAAPATRAAVLPVFLVASAFLVATLLAVLLLPENLSLLRAWLIRRYTARWANAALRNLQDLGGVLSGARRLLRGKVATLALVTLGIWTLEGATLAMLLPGAAWPLAVAGTLGVQSAALVPGLASGAVEAGLASHYRLVVGSVVGVSLAALALAAARGGLRESPEEAIK